MVYPITAHAMGHQHDEDGGFVIEATTIQDPIGFATTLEDENGPLWGTALVEAVREIPPLGRSARDGERRQQRQRAARRERRGVVRGCVHTQSSASASTARSSSRARCSTAAGASSVRWTGLLTTHVQGTCRMGSDPERSVVDRGRTVLGRQAALRRRRLARPADALRQPVAHDHGPREPARRPPARRPARVSRLTEPIRDLAHLSHVELLTPKPDESLHYFREILGLEVAGESRRLGLPARLRRLRAIVAEADRRRAGGGRRTSPTAPTAPRRSSAGSRHSRRPASHGGWLDGDLGHGPAYGFLDPDGHRYELFYESERYEAPPELRPGAEEPAAALPGPRRRSPPPRPRQLPRRRPRREPRLRSRSTSGCD